MMGPPSSRGVNYRCLTEVMKLCEARKATHVNKVTVSLLEAYNDSLRDLLADDSGKSAEPLQLRAEATAQAYIERYGHAPGAHTMRVHSVDDVVAVMTVGDCYRIFASTQVALAPISSPAL